MIGRESKQENDVFFTCSLIEYIARATHNHRRYVANALGRDRIEKIYELADVYHSDNIDDVCDAFVKAACIAQGNFDNVAAAHYMVPSHWDIGKVYKRLVLGIMREQGLSVPDAILAAYNSFVTEKIEDYDSAFYYDNPQNILNSYLYDEITV